MAKTCKVEGCNNPVFTHGYCHRHRYLYYGKKQPNKGSVKRSTVKSSISPLSNKKRLKKTKIASIKKRLVEANGNRCFFCGKEVGVDAAHIFPISLFPEYETEEWNIILSCRKHHMMFDDGNYETILKIPNVEFILDLIEAVDSKYHNRIKNRNNEHTKGSN